MNKAIQYREDGKFYGLVNVPEKPKPINLCRVQCAQWLCGCHLHVDEMSDYEKEFQSCIAAGKEIINPEVAVNSEVPFCMNSSGQWIHAQTCVLLKPGEIFDCPDNIEFEEQHQFYCMGWCDCSDKEYHSRNVRENVKADTRKAIRLKFKQEVKPVESQYDLWAEAVYICMMSGNINELKSKFTITRNKNGNE